MASTLQWFVLLLGLHGELSRDRLVSLGIFTSYPSEKCMVLQLLLPVFCIAHSQCVPIFEEVPSLSG
jgi:hypothetical protein